MKSLKIKENIYWIGALDPDLRIFDVIMYTPFGTTYNSYIVKGENKVAIFETVKEEFFDEYIERLKSLHIDPENIDYIVLNHTEPDHAGSLDKLLNIAKNAKVVGSSNAIRFLKDIINKEFDSIIVKDNDTLNLGNKTLQFISAPFLHWPDSMYTYIKEDNVLFSCDSFGSHYCHENIFNDTIDNTKEYTDSLKYYFDCIMGPFKPYVLKALDKIDNLNIDVICPGHGPILRKNPQKVLDLYRTWSTPKCKTSDKKHIVICYVSSYGYTKSIAQKISEGIQSNEKFNVKLLNVIHHKQEEILQQINDSDAVLFGSPTIVSDALKPILDILTCLNPIINGRTPTAAFGSYGWSGEAVPNIESRLKQLRMKILLPGLRIKFKPSNSELETAFKFGEDFASKLLE